MSHNPYIPIAPDSDNLLRLICLPHAGGGSASFHRWQSALPDRLVLVPVCLPGRETRVAEPPRTDLRSLAVEIVEALAETAPGKTGCGVCNVNRPYALLGHSVGAWIAFEMAREIRRRSLPMPVLLIVAASPAPHAIRSGSLLHHLPDAEFVAEISRRFDGIPPEVRDHDELLRLLLPALRADIQMMETYQYNERPPLDIDMLAIGGTSDPAVSPTELAGWSRHTSANFSVRLVPGGHFFLFQDAVAHRSPDVARMPTVLPPAASMIVGRLERYIGKIVQ
jgi:surfactin synthase thioesterase subunit